MSFNTYRKKNNLASFSSYRKKFSGYSSYRIINSSMLSNIESLNMVTRDAFERPLVNLILNPSSNSDAININVLSLDYLLFKDKEIIASNPHLVIDGALSISKIMGLAKINFYLNKCFIEEHEILKNALDEALNEGYLAKTDVSIITDSKIGYYELNRLDNLFDVESVCDIALLAQLGYNNYLKNEDILISLTGDVKSINLYSIERNKTIREIIETKDDIPIKCVFTGGFSNRAITDNEASSIKLDYKSFRENNLIRGNGIICAIKENTCIIRVLFKIVLFCISMSCHRCIPCRSGFIAIKNYLKDIIMGSGNNKDYVIMRRILSSIAIAAICPQMKLFSSSILSTIDIFESEFIHAIENKRTMYSFYDNEDI